MNSLPKLVGGVEPRYSICQATRMQGKTVKKVRFGMREDSKDRHQSEALHVEFTDGAILGIETGSNAGNIADKVSMQTNEFHVDFMLTGCRPLQTGSCTGIKPLPQCQSPGELTDPMRQIATTLPSLVRAGRPRSQGSQPSVSVI